MCLRWFVLLINSLKLIKQCPDYPHINSDTQPDDTDFITGKILISSVILLERADVESSESSHFKCASCLTSPGKDVEVAGTWFQF